MPDDRRVALAADHAGLPLKIEVRKILDDLGIFYEDYGTQDDKSVDYPDFAHRVAEAVSSGEVGLGILVCGTGVGMSIAANRHRGVRAVVCSEVFSARAAREHNDANVLCFGARVIGAGTARDLIEAFLTTKFSGGRHVQRVEKIEPR